MKERFESIAEDLDWYFDYGRKDYHNLYDQKDGKTFKFFLDPITEDDKISELGNTESITFEGYFMILMNSTLDKVYDAQLDSDKSTGRYENYIKRCKEQADALKKILACNEYEIKRWKKTEVINLFDTNFDGVLVNFQIIELL